MNSQPQSNAPQAAHIVLDLETLSTQPNAVIASIGAVALTASGGFVSEFHVPITTGNFRQCHRHVCAKTVEWWEQQSEEAKLASVKAPNPTLPHPALQAFIAWVHEHADPKKVKVWGNGSSFDNVILSSLFADYPELERPWAYWNDRDMRTVLDLNPAAKDVGPFEGVKHNALHDARHEAKQLAKVLMATQPAVQEKGARDDAFEAVRKAFCKLQRYSFFLDGAGNVRRCADHCGNWVEFDAVHTLFEPQSVDAALAAQAKQEQAA